MSYYLVDKNQNAYLAHHGIRGQKWGERHGPPYPLNRETHNRVVGKKDVHRKGKTRGLSQYGRYSEGRLSEQSWFQTDPINEFSANRHNFREVMERSGHKRMTAPEFFKQSETNEYTKDRFRLDDRHGKIGDYDCSVVNRKDLNGDSRGTQNNCSKCSESLALRAKGYAVIAGRAAYGMKESAASYHWNGAETYREKDADSVFDRLCEFGNKGMGTIGFRRPVGSGHAVYWQNEKNEQTGKYEPTFYDGQIGTKYVGKSGLERLIASEGFGYSADTYRSSSGEVHSMPTGHLARITNLSNATPNWDHMSEDSVSRIPLTDWTVDWGKDGTRNYKMNYVVGTDRKTGKQTNIWDEDVNWTG